MNDQITHMQIQAKTRVVGDVLQLRTRLSTSGWTASAFSAVHRRFGENNRRCPQLGVEESTRNRMDQAALGL